MASDDSPIPEGWWLIEKTGANGKIIKCYKNEIGQQFDTMKDLMRYVTYAKSAQLSIYAPDYVSPGAKKQKKLMHKKKKTKQEVSDSSSENDSEA